MKNVLMSNFGLMDRESSEEFDGNRNGYSADCCAATSCYYSQIQKCNQRTEINSEAPRLTVCVRFAFLFLLGAFYCHFLYLGLHMFLLLLEWCWHALA